MGSSNSTENQAIPQIKNNVETVTPVQVPTLPPPPVIQVQKIEEQVDTKVPQQNIFDIQNETTRKKDERKSIDLGACAIAKVKRQLPPLKKIRSNKRLEYLTLQSKHNLSTNQNLLNVQNVPQNTLKVDTKTSARDIQVEEIQEESEKNIVRSDKNFRQTRTKKLRLSKQQQNIPGAYF